MIRNLITSSTALIDASPGLDAFIHIPSKRPVSGLTRGVPDSVGTATMPANGTLELQLRSDEHGTFAEALLVIPRSDPRYPGMREHLGAIEPGRSCAIRPFPG
jgi:hypothetical protein